MQFAPLSERSVETELTKGQIIERVLNEMRAAYSHKIRRPIEEDEREQEVITHLEKLLRDAAPDEDVLTCTDFNYLQTQCCTTCHFCMFPFDFSQGVRLRTGEYAWVCCAIGSAIKSGGAKIPVKSQPPEQPAKSAGHKPFTDFFGGKSRDHDDAK